MSLFDEYVSIILDTVLIGGFGWVFFVALLVYMFYIINKMRHQDQVAAKVEWMFLEVKIDNLNEKSPLAMEQVFAALHAIHQNFTWGEIYMGKSVLYVSCEIVSIGGKVSYIFKIP